MAPSTAFFRVYGSLHEERADGPWREACRIHRHARLVTRLSYQQSDDAAIQGLLECRLIKSAENAVDGGVVSYMPQPQSHAQLCGFGQPDCGFINSPVFMAHQAENGEQRRLLKAPFRECAAVGRQRGLAHVQRHSGKFHEPNFGHCAHFPLKTYARWPRMSTELNSL
jgi:hypothetical protein